MVGKHELTYSGDRTLSRPHVSFGVLFTYFKVINNLAKAHNKAYEAIKLVKPNSNVNLVHHVVAFDSNRNIINRIKATTEDWFVNHLFLRKVYKKCDSFGLNFYHYVKYGDRPTYKKTDMGWEMAPEGIYHALKTLWRYKRPIYISEAGIADNDDSDRAVYIFRQVEATWRAIQEGVDVRAHIYWSLLDNYEWALGYEKRFGLVEVNYQTLERTIRPSAYVYKNICEANAVVE